MLLWPKICYFGYPNEWVEMCQDTFVSLLSLMYSLEHCGFWGLSTHVVSSVNVDHALEILHLLNVCALGV